MTAQPYILARTMGEAHSYARGILGLVHGQYRIVNSPGTVKSVRGADLILVPGWERRFDRFAMKGALRWTRMNIVKYPEGVSVRDLEVAYRYNRLRDLDTRTRVIVRAVPDDTEPPKSHTDLVARVLPDAVPDGLEPSGEQLVIVSGNGDNMISEGGPVTPESEDKPVKRRRSRCKECGTLHFRDETCPSEPFPLS